jgi:formylglycine-generating enzyme required for sulfatase activity
MAFIPDGPQGSFFIGLFEVSAGEWNAYCRANREKPLPGPAELPARNVTMRQVRRFLSYVGGVLPTAEEWRLAALGRDGRKLPWGKGDVSKMAHLNDWDADGPEAVTTRPGSASPYGLHHVLGNVWELVEGGFAMGGSWVTPYPLELTYRRADGRSAKWRPDLLADPRPLEPAKERLDGERRRKWKEALYDDPEAARVNQGGIGLRLVIRIGR